MSHIFPTRLAMLRNMMQQKKIDGWLVPSHDAFQGEYIPMHDERLAWITGFTGSYGLAVVLAEEAAFFTDGRYTLQAEQEVSSTDYMHYNLSLIHI